MPERVKAPHIFWSGTMARTISTAKYVCTIPDGWLYCICPDGLVVISHPDHMPRVFKNGEWHEVGFKCDQ